jgi:hypothetical protein
MPSMESEFSSIEERNTYYNLLSPQQQLAEISKCRSSFSYWINNYGTILDTLDGEFKTFKLFPKQEEFVKILETESLICCLKSRQTGWSWLNSHWGLYNAIMRPNCFVGVVSIDGQKAAEFLQKIFWAFDNLPLWMKPTVLSRRRQEELSFGVRDEDENGQLMVRGLNSTVRVYSNTADFLRGNSPQVAILDEADFYADMLESIWPSAIGSRAVSRGQFIFISSPNKRGVGGFFFNMYWGAGRPGGQFQRFKKFFAGYDTDPRRSAEWEEENRQLLGADFRCEHPLTDQEAWAVGSACYFDRNELEQHINDYIQTPTPPRTGQLIVNYRTYGKNKASLLTPAVKNKPDFEFIDEIQGWFQLWKPPESDHQYVMGADTSWGMPQSDHCAAYAMDCETMELVAGIYGRFPDNDFAYLLADVGHYYNHAFLGVEANQGIMINKTLSDHGEVGYTNLYLREITDGLNPVMTTKLGWFSTNHTRKNIYDRFKYYWRTKQIHIYDIELLYEMQNIFPLGGLRLGTIGKKPDDRVRAAALTLEMYFSRPLKAVLDPTDTEMKMQYHMALKKSEEMRRQGQLGLTLNPLWDDEDDAADLSDTNMYIS